MNGIEAEMNGKTTSLDRRSVSIQETRERNTGQNE